MNDSTSDADRLEELLVNQALFEITAEERNELNRLLESSKTDPELFERVAALAFLAFQAAPIEPLPSPLLQKIRTAFPADVATPKVSDQSIAQPTPPNSELSKAKDDRRDVRAFGRRREVLAWAVATASLAFVSVSWWNKRSVSVPAVSLADSRLSLLKNAQDVVQVDWTPTDGPGAKGVGGNVVWSNQLQQGFMQFQGLARNESTRDQYQLWIFDEQQDARFPIDGGVFDVASGDVIVPIKAAIHVAEPKMFAITIEKAGGVVVSDRKRLVLIAKL
jgi:anti-sigma-K factor RskA